MFLGQAVPFTRSGNTLTGFDGAAVGAIHISETGYDGVRITGTGVDASFSFEDNGGNRRDGYQLLTFPNANPPSLSFSWLGTGTVDWTTARVFTTDIALGNELYHDRPYRYSPVFSLPETFRYSTATKINGQFGFEWRNLRWEKVDELEALFDRHGALGNPRFWLIPDGFEADRYEVVITSAFDFYPSTPSNFHAGASGALVFETVT